MYDDGRVVDLLALPGDEAGWFDLQIPDASPPVRLVRLHVDPATRASVALVAFPSGWQRPGVGHYLAGEEFVVLQGSLTVSGRDHVAGDWAWLPPLATRWDSRAPHGALALAWFSGPAIWRGAAGDETATAQAQGSRPEPGPLRTRRSGVPGESEVSTALTADPADTDRELLSLPDLRWVLVPAHRPPPLLVGPLLVRHWS